MNNLLSFSSRCPVKTFRLRSNTSILCVSRYRCSFRRCFSRRLCLTISWCPFPRIEIATRQTWQKTECWLPNGSFGPDINFANHGILATMSGFHVCARLTLPDLVVFFALLSGGSEPVSSLELADVGQTGASWGVGTTVDSTGSSLVDGSDKMRWGAGEGTFC